MADVNPHQVWEKYSKSDNRWRPVRVVNVLGDEIEIQYLDMPCVSDVARTRRASRERMLNDQNGNVSLDVPTRYR